MQQYLDMLRHILENGNDRGDRTGTGTRGVFGYQTRFDLAEGFPAVTTKRLAWKTAARELLWFLTGNTSIRPLLQQKVTIWTDWPLAQYRASTGDQLTQKEFEARIVADESFAEEWGDLGPVYGKQWRSWEGADGVVVDQIAEVIEAIRHNPTSRRLIVDCWNVVDIPKMALPPCHFTFQFYVADGKLSCHLYQRSADVFLGVPFNIASYALLTMMIAQVCGLEPGEFIHTFGDLHIYNNHVEQVQLLLTREPYQLPRMKLNPARREIDDFVIDDFTLEGYQFHPEVKGEVSV